jgi:hypothetical protein
LASCCCRRRRRRCRRQGSGRARYRLGPAEAAEIVVVAADERLTVAFNTKYELIDLPVESGLAAADEAGAVAAIVVGDEAAERRRTAEEDGIVEAVIVVRPEGAAGIHADVKARPGEDRNRRRIGNRWRRPAGRQIGGGGRPNACDRSGSGQKQFPEHPKHSYLICGFAPLAGGRCPAGAPQLLHGRTVLRLG